MLSVNHLGFGACLGKKRDAKGKPLSVFLFSKLIEANAKRYSKLISVGGPTGFGSWMIIKKETIGVIGDIGFKGCDFAN